jgi:uncharacterized protein YcfJ
MKPAAIVIACLLSTQAFGQEVQYANIVSVTPYTENVVVIKQQCGGSAGYTVNERSLVGAAAGTVVGGVVGHQVGKGKGNILATIVGAIGGAILGDMIDNRQGYSANCRNVETYEPVPGGYEIVYELNGQQYSTISKTFPKEKILAVQMAPKPID